MNPEVLNAIALAVAQPAAGQLGPAAALLSLLSGTAVGFSLGLVGGGGSVLALPLLIYVVGLPPHVSIGTSALSVAVNAVTNLVQHARRGHVRAKKGVLFAVPGAAGAFFGAQLGLLTPPSHLLVLFGLFMMGIAAFMLIHRHAARGGNADGGSVRHTARLVPTGVLAGLAAGYFGIGGGFLVTPAMISAGGLGILDAIGTSLLPVSAFGLATAARYAAETQVDWAVSGLFMAGGLGGGMVGTRLAGRLPLGALAKLFAAILVAVAVYVILRNLAA